MSNLKTIVKGVDVSDSCRSVVNSYRRIAEREKHDAIPACQNERIGADDDRGYS